jgi:amidase
MSFNPLTATCSELQHLLETAQLTSLDIVERYLDQIAKFDKVGPRLNAMISVAPRHLLLRHAMELDEERRGGNVRGPLHGIPVTLKDSILTKEELGMPTTGGSWAFMSERSRTNAEVVERLFKQGMIVLGKNNLSEYGGLKASRMVPGWSSYGGLSLSPYVPKIDPDDGILGHSKASGSSGGSAISLAAGYAPLSIGADTCGSISTPAVRLGLYSLKPTIGLVSLDGVLGLSEWCDSLGPMAKSARDIELALIAIISDDERCNKVRDMIEDTSNDPKDISGLLKSLKLGFGSPDIWNLWESVCRRDEGTLEQMVRNN